MWIKDNIKIDIAKKNNFDVLVIWEKEWIENKEETIKKCKIFLKDFLNE